MIRRYLLHNCQSGFFANYVQPIFTYTNSTGIVYVNDYTSTNSVQTQTFDTLFYFNAPVGYQWLMLPTSYTSCTTPVKPKVTVNAIGTKTVQGITLKWQAVSYNTELFGASQLVNDTIYERFGYLKTDFFNPNNFCSNTTDIQNDIKFRCYSDNQIINYKYGHTNNCDYVTAISEYTKPVLQVYPNPVNEILFLKDDLLDFQNSTIEISDVMGRTLVRARYSNKLNVSDLPTGIYFLMLNNKSVKTTVRFIKL